jgi:hypothetical protein
VALQLKRWGITRVHPLDGGLARWRVLNFPVWERPAPDIPALTTAIEISAR